MLRRTFKYRLYPTPAQCQALDEQVDEACRRYNAALDERRSAWRMNGISIRYLDQASQLKTIRAAGHLGVANFSACQDVLRRVDKTFAGFFRRIKTGEKAGYPRFRSCSRYVSLTYPSWGDGCALRPSGHLYLQGVGEVKVKWHRILPANATIKTVSAKREAGHWYVCFSLEMANPDPLPVCDGEVGIDVGLTTFATLSDDTAIAKRSRRRKKARRELAAALYIIRENKTYDEEFGDEPAGDPAGLLYGRTVTPNAHALAERYALLEDFSANEELSDTGHHALFGGVVNDFIERESQQGYGLDQAPRLSLEDGPAAGNDVGWSPGAYLIDDALSHGLTFRDYGEFYRESQSQVGPALTAALDAHIVRDFPGFGFNLGVKDTDREAFWEQFATDVRNGTFPSLEVIYLPTENTSLGAASLGNADPAAEVADNDLATGRIVQALSNSRYWSSTAVFLTEDDPQSGIDHVDVHRTIGLVASPFVRHGLQSTRHYDQAGMLRTMELIPGLPPMAEFDAVAQPMTDLFQSNPVSGDQFTAHTPLSHRSRRQPRRRWHSSPSS